MKKTSNYLNRDFKKKRGKDLLTPKKRSLLMSKIRSKNTTFEIKFISALRKTTKKKISTNVSSIQGKPDIVFQKNMICVFLDSDFWHGWYYPRWKHLLKNDFWRTKIHNNRMRDRKTTQHLRKKGWTVLRLWEHSIVRDTNREIQKILIELNK